MTSPSPLDTPPDWHDRIARRAAEWRDLGPDAALRLWHSRGECSRAVLDIAASVQWPTAILDARGIEGGPP